MRTVALVAAAVLAAACSRGGDPQARGPRAVAVRAARALERDVPVEVRAVGRIVSNQSVAIRAQVSGLLVSAHFTEGQAVRKGDRLLEIDRRPYEAQLAQAQARLAQDRARAEHARADAARYAELVQKEYVTRQQYEQTKADATALDAQVAADQAAVQAAELDVAYCTIRSPASGRTGRLLLHPGNLVTANAPVPLVTIEQLEPVFASFSIPERYLPALRGWRGRPPPVRIQAGQGDEIAGALDFVDNAVDAATGTILLKARIPNEDEALWPGQVVELHLRVAQREKAIVVPAAAVAQGQQGDYAYVVGPDRKAVLRAVVVEQAGDAETVLSRGVSAGELVVTEGQLKLQPGAPVELLEDKAPGT
jgi:multidrug efflux system membrane fusion protein